MKRFLTSLMCLVLAVVANAQTWSAPSEGMYSDRFVVYVKLNVNGEQVTSAATLAAFIGDDCRGMVNEVEATNANGFYPLEVWGKTDDNSKTVTFKAQYDGVAYSFTKTLSYSHQSTSTPIPFVLNIDKVTGLSVTNPINVTQNKNTTYNLNQHVSYTYQDNTGATYTPLNESSVDSSTPLTLSWSSESNAISINNGVMTINDVAQGISATVQLLDAMGSAKTAEASTVINISEPIIAVTGMRLSAETMECWVGDNILPTIEGMTTIIPENASNKAINVAAASGSEDGFESSPVASGFFAKKAGVWTVVVSSADNAEIKKTITVTVKQHVTGISASQSEITVDLGDNVYNKVAELITVLPADATNTNLSYAPQTAGYITDSIAVAEGEVVVKVTSEDNAQATTNVTVKIVCSVNFAVPASIETTLNKTVDLVLTNQTGNGFKAENVTIEFADGSMATADKDATGLKFTVTGKKIGCTTYTVSYLGRSRGEGTLYVDASIDLKAGWNWVSNYTNLALSLKTADNQYNTAYFSGDAKINEIRTQSALLYNDATYGMFGQITEIAAENMYKVNAAAQRSIVFRPTGTTQHRPEVQRKGYTWISYPIVGDHSFAYFNSNDMYLNNADMNDMIIGKDGFATYNGTEWVASNGFKLETGKGYIYYQEDAADKQLYFGESYMDEPQAAPAKGMRQSADVWEYDANAFADNMCIIANVKGIAASSKYSVGAFVNGECRGKGAFVDGDMMFISVAGKSGETVTFRLYNSETNEYSDIAERMDYTMMKGSLAAPAMLTASEVTGINNVNVNGNGNNAAYNLAGQRVAASAKGIVIKGGKKFIK